MGKKYSKIWFEVHEIMSKAQKKIYEKVKEMCEELKRDIGGLLDELAEQYGFTYVIQPKEGNGVSYDCKPCVFIEAPKDIVKKVEREVLRRYPDIVSDSRLVFEQKIAYILLPEKEGEK